MNRKAGVLLMATCVMLAGFATSSVADDAATQKAVLITGASTGIGRNAAEKLAAEGYFVYAGARKAKDIEELNKIENVMAVRLDVTSQDEIDAAVKLIEGEGRGLWGVVNNAGVNVVGPLIELEESDLEFLFDVNIYGPYRVTRSFAPMIIESKGRIVNISSISGTLSGPGYGIYSASKHALEAFTDSLKREMDELDVTVSAVEPGNYNSQIGLTRCQRMVDESDETNYTYFEEYRLKALARCKERLANGDGPGGAEPDRVAEAIQHALFDENPKEHYLVVPNQDEARWTITKAFEELLSLNQDHDYSYSRDELIAIMDEEWAHISGEKSEEE